MNTLGIKAIVFDLDGTVADLYGVPSWEPRLRAEDASPYIEAQPLVDMKELSTICKWLKMFGLKIIITSWLAKDSTPEYKNATRNAKLLWLKEHGFDYDEIHLVQYGTPKSRVTKKYGEGQILIDDSEKVRNEWKWGQTIDANKDIIKELTQLLLTIVEKNL